MLKADQIPSEVTRAAWKAMRGNYKTADDLMDATISAAINAWPGMRLGYTGFRMDKSELSIILPLQEPTND